MPKELALELGYLVQITHSWSDFKGPVNVTETFGVCQICEVKIEHDERRLAKTVEQELKRLESDAWRIFDSSVNYTKEQAVKLAVEWEYDPMREPDPKFREWLLENPTCRTV